MSSRHPCQFHHSSPGRLARRARSLDRVVPPPLQQSPARRTRFGNIFGRIVLVLLLIVVVAAAAWGLGALNRKDAAPLGPPPFLVPIQEVEPGVAAPGSAAAPGNTT